MSMSQPSATLYHQVRLQARKGRAVVACSRCKGVDDLAEAMRPWICQGGESDIGQQYKDGREGEDDERKDERVEHRHLHVEGFDLLAQVFRSAAHHETGDEHREHDEDEHAVKAGHQHPRKQLRRA